jgi:ABC-type sugar transport system substrate-binding protein
MKKQFTILLAILLMLSFVGCGTASTTEEAPAAEAPAEETVAEAPADAAAVEDADNPLAGKAVDENGDPYLLGYVLNETSSGWMSANLGYTKSLWERAGGEFVSYVSDYDLNLETSMMNDLEQLDPDAILVHPSDSAAIAPAVQNALDAGYPVFAVDMAVTGADVKSYVHIDQVKLGEACGQYIADNFSADNPAVVLEIAGGLQQSGAQQRMEGFHNIVEPLDYAEIVQTVDTGWSSDVAFDGIQDAFERNADINVLYTHSDFMMQGILEGLRVKGKLNPAGEEGHIVLCSIDGDPTGLQGIRDGYIDAIAEHNPVLHAAVTINVILAELYGQPYEADYTLPVTLITPENVESMDRWANLPAGEYGSWPVMIQDVFPIPSK